ncbi:hypothetical protein [Paenibacillus sp. TH7-28]
MDKHLQVLMDNFHGAENRFLNAVVDGYFQGYLVDERSFGGEWFTEPDPSVIHLDFLKQG